MQELILFGSSYIVVLMLGLQSQFVRDKKIIESGLSSLMIGTCQLFLYKLTPDANIISSICFIFGGSLGIISSIYLHNFYLRLFK